MIIRLMVPPTDSARLGQSASLVVALEHLAGRRRLTTASGPSDMTTGQIAHDGSGNVSSFWSSSSSAFACS